MNTQYTYYAGFEKDFKRITKKFSSKSFYEKKYEKEITEYQKIVDCEIKNELEIKVDIDDFSDDDDDDDFDNIESNNKKIKANKVNEIKDKHFFYYYISKIQNNTENKKYECNIIILDEDIKLWLEDENITIDKLNDFDVIYLDDIFCSINDFRIKMSEYKNPKYLLFINYMENLFSKDYKKYDKMVKSNKLEYDMLWYYYDKIKTYYITKVCGKDVCFSYNSFYYKGQGSSDGSKLVIGGSITLCSKLGTLYDAEIDVEIDFYSGHKQANTFNIRKANEEDLEKFKSDSDKIISLMKEIKQMKLEGTQYVIMKGTMVGIDRNEKVMVDNFFKKIDTVLPPCIKAYIDDDTLLQDKEDKAILFPFVPIYNLGCAKMWGITYFGDLCDIKYNVNIFDDIVLDKNKKDFIKILTKNYNCNKSSNLIEGKGQNLIFLLHGPPGVGKTLTAEATSEYLEKPLYHINIGDLDLNPSALEVNLDDIDKICKHWKALLLIDEADIFLEERNYSDIGRNTIVSLFLKFLEYSKNIIFLTTNRLSTIDLAVKSRISLIITYPKLEKDNRSDIWNKLLSKVNIKDKSKLIKRLSNKELNGREIGNLLDIVVTIVKSKNENDEIEMNEFIEIFDKCLEITNESNLSNVKGLYL